MSLSKPDILDKSTMAQIAQHLSKHFRSVPCHYSLLPQMVTKESLASKCKPMTLKNLILQTMSEIDSKQVSIDEIINQMLLQHGKDKVCQMAG